MPELRKPAWFDSVLANLPDGSVRDVRIGIHWTAAVVETGGRLRCGLAATQMPVEHEGATVAQAGQLTRQTGRELAGLIRQGSPTEASIGLAAINALLPAVPTGWGNVNASELLAERGAGKRVVVVGHFPFVHELRERVGTLWVLELFPRPGDLPASAAAEVVPQADVLAITATTLLNHTFDGLMALRRPEALTMLLGPSTPLTPLLFGTGIDLLSGAIVENIDAVLAAVSQGAGFRQIHRAGVKLVTLQR
jgi:hypothetical protein